MRELGIPLGLGANFDDNLEIILSVFNRAKNNIGNPSLPAEFSEALGLSTTLRDMVGKYFSVEYMRKNVLKQSESEIAEMDKQIKQEIDDGIISSPFAQADADDDTPI